MRNVAFVAGLCALTVIASLFRCAPAAEEGKLNYLTRYVIAKEPYALLEEPPRFPFSSSFQDLFLLPFLLKHPSFTPLSFH